MRHLQDRPSTQELERFAIAEMTLKFTQGHGSAAVRQIVS